MTNWVPLQTSGVAFTTSFTSCTLFNSILTCDNAIPNNEAILFTLAQTLKITNLAWDYSGVGNTPPIDKWTFNADGSEQTNDDATEVQWLPTPFQASISDGGDATFVHGTDDETPRTFSFLIEVDVPGPVVYECTELGRASKAIVSAYNRTRVQQVNLIGNETRCLTADFSGALPKSRSIASVIWQMNSAGWVNISNCRITGRAVSSIDIATMWNSLTFIRCSATMDDGHIFTQMFRVHVRGVPWFPLDNFVFNGNTSLSATA